MFKGRERGCAPVLAAEGGKYLPNMSLKQKPAARLVSSVVLLRDAISSDFFLLPNVQILAASLTAGGGLALQSAGGLVPGRGQLDAAIRRRPRARSPAGQCRIPSDEPTAPLARYHHVFGWRRQDIAITPRSRARPPVAGGQVLPAASLSAVASRILRSGGRNDPAPRSAGPMPQRSWPPTKHDPHNPSAAAVRRAPRAAGQPVIAPPPDRRRDALNGRRSLQFQGDGSRGQASI